MKNNFNSRLLLLVTIFFVLCSCRNELNEQNISNNLSASKFKFVTLKDIPEVARYIHAKTGREDFQIPNHHQNTAKTFDFSTVNLSTIVKKTEGEITYYVFGIDPAIPDEKTVYTLEIKELRGQLESMNIITYQSAHPLSDDPKTRFDYFTGTVSSTDIEGKTGSTVDYSDGVGDCPDAGGDGGNSDSGSGDIGSSDIPPNGGWYDGGGSGHNGEEPWSEDPTGCWDIITDPVKPWITLGWSNHCNGQYISNVNKMASRGGFGKLTADCSGDGSGVIVINPTTPCEKIKAVTNNSTYKSNILTLEGKTSDGYESGFRINLPTQNGSINQILQNKPGTKEVNITFFANTVGAMHSHYDGLYPIFSPGDIYLFNQWVTMVYNNNQVTNPNVPIPPLEDIFFTLVTSNGNYMLKFDTSMMPNQLPVYTQQQFDDLNRKYIEDYLDSAVTVGNVSGNISYDTHKLEKEFLTFVKKEMNMPGLKLYRTTGSENIELSLVNGNLKETTCP
ncbi:MULTISPECIES: hypothetical protein [Chryseobacterium]|uniref:Uncharacterized protein n=1 Tax=Chryseobacterium camelliae TaxID=1265445 RepID=A0ABU0TK99_9FLAO|nr:MULTISPECIES: hypothetical protein [Chryseobacterium]MDT3408680.1 hypothetical protein [Pseudacidovorax intermedius]MDQ1097466.1 hypothetical protein [Chryseobacterium camelliae]MDQ1101395.1 hypothetical protein [Chryseobacterium sp. SORGH_AS_1048]MDR6084839.1 hypothetical protein [Chryseobacterium sp. SORGH_AS_0909]MDR6129189.1 hypothetical protein [Chryseobacterium sp. SORGH_AS_1175]